MTDSVPENYDSHNLNLKLDFTIKSALFKHHQVRAYADAYNLFNLSTTRKWIATRNKEASNGKLLHRFDKPLGVFLFFGIKVSFN